MAKIGRPKTEVPMDVVDAACQLNATANQVLEILASQGHKISYNTLVREIKRLYGLSFEDYRDKKTDLTRLKLAQKAVKMGLDGNATMLIFCLKNLCGWTDRQELKASHDVTEKSVHAQVVDVIKKLEEKSA